MNFEDERMGGDMDWNIIVNKFLFVVLKKVYIQNNE
jgi:hypothetical protein